MKYFLFILIPVFFVMAISCGKKDSGNETFSLKEDLTIQTSDGLKLSAEFFSPIEKETDKKYPLVILIHQFNSTKEQWTMELIDSLVKRDFCVIRFDLRSHGKSDKANVKMEELLSDISQIPKDLEAVVNWARNNATIDPARTGIVGTSVGAALALNGAHYLGIKTFVAISLGKYTYEKLTGNYEELLGAKVIRRVPNGLFICGMQDGNYLKESQVIYDNFLMDPKEFKQFNSEKHGKDLISDFPGINDLILNWFGKYL